MCVIFVAGMCLYKCQCTGKLFCYLLYVAKFGIFNFVTFAVDILPKIRYNTSKNKIKRLQICGKEIIDMPFWGKLRNSYPARCRSAISSPRLFVATAHSRGGNRIECER